MFLRRVLCLLAALLALAVPGLVPGGEARAFALCQQSARMTPEEEVEIKDDLIASTPVRFAAAVHAISLRGSQADGEIAPYWQLNGNVVVIPDGFRRMQCQLVLVQFLLYRQTDDRVLTVLQSVFETCVDRLGDVAGCLPSTMNAAAEVLGPMIDPSFPAEDRETAAAIVRAAFRHVLLHEVGHIVLGHRPGGSLEDQARQELAADQYAVIGTFLTGGPAMAAFSTFAVLSILDNRADWSRAPHQSFACRARGVENVIGRLFAPVRALSILQYASDDQYRALRQDNDAVSAELMLPGQRDALRARPCREAPMEPLISIERDLLALTAALDVSGTRIPAATDVPGMRAFIGRLRAVPLATADARRIRESIISTRLYSILNDPAADRQAHDALIDETLRGPDDQDWLAQDYGRYFYLRAIAKFVNAPAGSPVATVMEETGALVARALFYNPKLASAHLLQSEIAYMAGRCEDAVGAGRRALATANDPEAQRERIELREQLYRTRGCAVAQTAIVDGHKSRAGWR